jgi:type II secretory pathway predicted ATPase ExeA
MTPARAQVPARVARRGLMLVLSSPSGAGKTTLSRMLLAGDPAVDELVVAAIHLARPDFARGHRHRQRHALVLLEQAARQRGLAGARGRRQHQHQPTPGDDRFLR